MTHSNITKFDFYLRLSVIIFAAICPFIYLFSFGYLKSISSYWNTPLQPIFIMANALTSYYLMTIDKWKISAFLLMLLTAFSIKYYPEVHNVLAILFFIVTAVSLKQASHYKFCFKIYLAGLVFVPFSLFVAETVAIVAMCIYHSLVLNRLYKVQLEREFNQNQRQA